MMRLSCAALLVALAIVGCGKADAGATGAASSAAPGSQTVTEVDFEEEAEAQIDASNMERELAALEKEIATGR
jgi:ABC-type glycerol-3-phosphate transport system substrate-binding protein